MFNIGQFFKNIQNRHIKELFIRSIIQASITQGTGVSIPIEDITISSGVIILKNISSGLRSVIFIKKQKILDSVNKNQTIHVVTNIR